MRLIQRYSGTFIYLSTLGILIGVSACSAIQQRAASENLPQPSSTANAAVVPTPIKESPSENAGNKGYSGVFSGLVAGVDEQTGVITGFYSDATGQDSKTGEPMFTCEFYLKGVFAADHYQVKAWYPGETESIIGKLIFNNKNVQLTLESSPDGCANVIQLTDDGATLPETARGKWSSIRVVSAEKAYFHKSAAAERSNAFVLKNDAVRVMKDDGEWMQAEFAGKKVTQGWLKSSDLYPADPQ